MGIPQLPYASRITLKCIFYSGSFSLPPRSNLIEKASCVDFLLPSTSPPHFPAIPTSVSWNSVPDMALLSKMCLSLLPGKLKLKHLSFQIISLFLVPIFLFSHCSSKLPKSLFRNFAPSVSSRPQR